MHFETSVNTVIKILPHRVGLVIGIQIVYIGKKSNHQKVIKLLHPQKLWFIEKKSYCL